MYVIQNAGRMSACPDEFSSENLDTSFGVINFASMSEEGFAKGIEQGKLEAARKMKAENVPIESIAKWTGLTLEQISEL